MTPQPSLFDEIPDAAPKPGVSYDDWCVTCGVETPHIFKGVRYCAEDHPDPGPHIRADRA